jgi:general secretion pathway protein I
MPRQADPMRGDDGFTLIEAIVALVMLSMALVAFYDFLSTSLQSADRIALASVAYDRHENALALANTINPMAMPKGSFDVGHYHIDWQSQPIDPIRQSSRYPFGPGLFMIALYRITLNFPDDHDIAPIVVTKLGYHRIGGPTNLADTLAGAGNAP